MAEYVDGFVLVVPKNNIAAYKKLATMAKKIWIEHGALDYRECVGDDLNTKMGVSFKKLTKADAKEMVVFAWITYKSKKHRDAVNKKVMKDKRMENMCDPQNPPFNMKKFSYGGFETLVK